MLVDIARSLSCYFKPIYSLVASQERATTATHIFMNGVNEEMPAAILKYIRSIVMHEFLSRQAIVLNHYLQLNHGTHAKRINK